MNAMNAITNERPDQKNNATTCNQQPNGGGKVTPAHYEELEELQLESVAGGFWWSGLVEWVTPPTLPPGVEVGVGTPRHLQKYSNAYPNYL